MPRRGIYATRPSPPELNQYGKKDLPILEAALLEAFRMNNTLVIDKILSLPHSPRQACINSLIYTACNNKRGDLLDRISTFSDQTVALFAKGALLYLKIEEDNFDLDSLQQEQRDTQEGMLHEAILRAAERGNQRVVESLFVYRETLGLNSSHLIPYLSTAIEQKRLSFENNNYNSTLGFVYFQEENYSRDMTWNSTNNSIQPILKEALLIAASKDRPFTMERLLHKAKPRNKDLSELIQVAATRGSLSVLEFLLKKTIQTLSIEASGAIVYCKLANGGNIEDAKKEMNSTLQLKGTTGIRPKSIALVGLRLAVKLNNIEVMNQLLNLVKFNSKDLASALHWTEINGEINNATSQVLQRENAHDIWIEALKLAIEKKDALICKIIMLRAPQNLFSNELISEAFFILGKTYMEEFFEFFIRREMNISNITRLTMNYAIDNQHSGTGVLIKLLNRQHPCLRQEEYAELLRKAVKFHLFTNCTAHGKEISSNLISEAIAQEINQVQVEEASSSYKGHSTLLSLLMCSSSIDQDLQKIEQLEFTHGRKDFFKNLFTAFMIKKFDMQIFEKMLNVFSLEDATLDELIESLKTRNLSMFRVLSNSENEIYSNLLNTKKNSNNSMIICEGSAQAETA